MSLRCPALARRLGAPGSQADDHLNHPQDSRVSVHKPKVNKGHHDGSWLDAQEDRRWSNQSLIQRSVEKTLSLLNNRKPSQNNETNCLLVGYRNRHRHEFPHVSLRRRQSRAESCSTQELGRWQHKGFGRQERRRHRKLSPNKQANATRPEVPEAGPSDNNRWGGNGISAVAGNPGMAWALQSSSEHLIW